MYIYTPYIGNRSQKKMFADFMNVGAFLNNSSIVLSESSGDLATHTIHKRFLVNTVTIDISQKFSSQMIPDIQYSHWSLLFALKGMRIYLETVIKCI